MDSNFNDEELLLRAVFPQDRRPDFWHGNRLSSAAFKDKNGLSVDRLNDRDIVNAVVFMREKRKLQGHIVSVSVGDCRSVLAFVAYKPTKDDVFHSEIHGSPDQVILDDNQCFMLSKKAVMISEAVVSIEKNT